jgi:hypothetical protein
MIALALASLFAVQKPPARFDYPAMNVTVIERTAGDVNALCRSLSGYRGTARILACALPTKRRCVILFPRGMTRTGLLYRHEQAHCNGWPATHPK